MGSRAVVRYSSLLGALVLLGASSARAEGPRPASPRGLPARVHLLVPECAAPFVDVKLLLELLRTELRDDGVRQVELGQEEPRQPRGPLAYLRVALPCEPDVRAVLLRAEDPASFKAVERQLELADVPSSAKARTMALGLAELLRASWPLLAMREPPLVPVPEGASSAWSAEPPTSAEPSSTLAAAEDSLSETPGTLPPPDPQKLLGGLFPQSRQGPSRREPLQRSFSMQLGGKALWFLEPGNRVWGGQVQGEYGRWSLGAQAFASSKTDFPGQLSLKLVTGTLGFTVLALSSESLELRSGVRVAAGRASMNGVALGETIMVTQDAAPYLAAMLTVRTRWWFSRAWAFTVEAEAGRATGLIATLGGQELASLQGWLGGLSAGMCFAP